MNPHLLNPAGRLWEFMSATWAAPDAQNLVSAWGAYLGGTPDEDRPRYFSAMSVVTAWPDDIRKLVAELPKGTIPRSQLLRGVTEAEAVLRLAPQAYGMQVAQAKQQFHQGTLSDLETCSRVLNAHEGIVVDDEETEVEAQAAGEPSPGPKAEEPLDAIRRLAEEIIAAVSGNDIPAEAKRILWEHASAISRAVDLYKIVGPEGLRREYEGTVGAVLLNPETRAVMNRDPGVWHRIAEIGKMIVLLGATADVPFDLIEKGHTMVAAITQIIGG
jgi:hypothetical protein